MTVECKKWPELHQKFKEAKPIDYQYSWVANHNVTGLARNKKRELDCIDIAWNYELSQSGLTAEQLQQELIIDLSQSLSRASWSRNKVRAITTGSTYYVYSLDRIITGSEHFTLLGMPLPAEIASSISERQLREMAGEAFAAPVAAVAMLALCKGLVDATPLDSWS